MKLIVNADDFGYSEGVNEGIIAAYKVGVVSSASIMTNMPGYIHAVKLAKENPSLGVGVHLVLTCKSALTGINRTITDENGMFFKCHELEKKIAKGQIDEEEIEREFTTQIEEVISSGLKPTHLDSHHHVHFKPEIRNVFFKTALKYRLPVRFEASCQLTHGYEGIKHPEVFIGDFSGEMATREYFRKIIEKHKSKDVVELMCHPAYVDQELLIGSSYAKERERELEVLCDGDNREYLMSHNIELINFGDIL